MKTKKILSMVLTGVTVIGLLAGCGSDSNTSGAGSTSDASTNQTAQNTASDAENQTADSEGLNTENAVLTDSDTQNTDSTAAEGGKTLVVYYSASGNTKEVAEVIADAAGADLFEVVPVEPYTDDDLNWTDDNSRVTKEHEDESLRDVELTTTEVPEWDSYDTVFIGFPIWWGEAPHIVYTLVENINLKGKTVVPFCTSMSSGIGQSAKHLKARAEISTKTKWKKGKNFYDVPKQKTVDKWIKTMK